MPGSSNFWGPMAPNVLIATAAASLSYHAIFRDTSPSILYLYVYIRHCKLGSGHRT